MSDDRQRRLTLVVPGLMGPALESGPQALDAARALTEGLRLDALELMLARAERVPRKHPLDDLEGLLFDCFQVLRSGSDWPVAPVTYAVDGGAADDKWVLRADPVHLRANMGEVTLDAGEDLDISRAEAESLAGELNAHFEVPGFPLEPLHPQRWYLRFEQPPELMTRPPSQLIGAPIRDHLPTGSDAGSWRAIMNEMQMILHASSINRDRESRGAPPVNGVWLWGGGRTPLVTTGLWQGAWGKDVLLEGLAQLAGTPAERLPEDAAAWLEAAETPGEHILVLTDAHIPARRADVDAWRDFLARLEECWLGPLLVALGGRDLEALTLRTEGERDCLMNRRRLSRWWRRRKPFADTMLAQR